MNNNITRKCKWRTPLNLAAIIGATLQRMITFMDYFRANMYSSRASSSSGSSSMTDRLIILI